MIYTEIFDSLQSFSKTINSRPLNKVFQEAGIEHSKTGSEVFTGTKDYEEADKLLQNGDMDKLEKLQKVNVKDLKTNGNLSKTKIEKGVCGCLPNIPLYLIGAPANMLNIKRIQYKSKILDMVINLTIDYTVTTDEMVVASAKIASVVKALELNGIRINLYIMFASQARKGEDCVCGVVKIKKSSSPLNMLNISYPLINPSMLRRHFLRFVETIPVRISKKYTRGYGSPILFTDVLKRDIRLKNKFKNVISINLGDILHASTDNVLDIIKQAKKVS